MFCTSLLLRIFTFHITLILFYAILSNGYTSAYFVFFFRFKRIHENHPTCRLRLINPRYGEFVSKLNRDGSCDVSFDIKVLALIYRDNIRSETLEVFSLFYFSSETRVFELSYFKNFYVALDNWNIQKSIRSLTNNVPVFKFNNGSNDCNKN